MPCWTLLGVLVGMLLALPPVSSKAASVQLIWDYTQGAIPAVGFAVYKHLGCDGETQRFTVPGSVLSFVDTSVVQGLVACYFVTAVGEDGHESAASNIVAVKCTKARRHQVVCTEH